MQIVEIFNQNNCSIRQTHRSLLPFYGVHNRPSERLIRRTIDRFRNTFTVTNNVHPVRRRTVRTEEAVAAVQESIKDDSNQSIRRRSQQLGLCPSTLWKILRKDLGLKAFKIQFVQELKPNDHRMRCQFGEWAEAQIDIDFEFPFKILFSDEADFWLKKQNCRIWSGENPQAFVETPLHPQKITVWCALWAGGVIDPYVFKNDWSEC